MRAVIVVDVPDEFMAGRAKFAAEELDVVGPALTPEEYFRERLESVCEDELPVALFGWPVEARALRGEEVLELVSGQERAVLRVALRRYLRTTTPTSPVAEAILERMGPPA